VSSKKKAIKGNKSAAEPQLSTSKKKGSGKPEKLSTQKRSLKTERSLKSFFGIIKIKKSTTPIASQLEVFGASAACTPSYVGPYGCTYPNSETVITC